MYSIHNCDNYGEIAIFSTESLAPYPCGDLYNDSSSSSSDITELTTQPKEPTSLITKSPNRYQPPKSNWFIIACSIELPDSPESKTTAETKRAENLALLYTSVPPYASPPPLPISPSLPITMIATKMNRDVVHQSLRQKPHLIESTTLNFSEPYPIWAEPTIIRTEPLPVRYEPSKIKLKTPEDRNASVVQTEPNHATCSTEPSVVQTEPNHATCSTESSVVQTDPSPVVCSTEPQVVQKEQSVLDPTVVPFIRCRGVPMTSNYNLYSNPLLLPVPERSDYVLTVIFDLDETLICTKVFDDKGYYEIYQRPYVFELFEALTKANCEILVWSAGSFEHVEKTVSLLNANHPWVKAGVYRNSSWYKGIPILKSLNLIPFRDPNRIVLIENNPHTCYLQFDKVVIVPSYIEPNINDNCLQALTECLVNVSRLQILQKPPPDSCDLPYFVCDNQPPILHHIMNNSKGSINICYFTSTRNCQIAPNPDNTTVTHYYELGLELGRSGAP